MKALWFAVRVFLTRLGLITPPPCAAACRAFVAGHPDRAVVGASLRATEPDRYIVAVLFREPDVIVKPHRYQLYAVSADLTTVEELPTNPDSPYWIRGRK